MKPRIQLLVGSFWICYGDAARGIGDSPRSAFRRWQANLIDRQRLRAQGF